MSTTTLKAQTAVAVGPTTIVGWSTAALAFVAALVAYLTGDHSAQSVTAVESAGAGLVILGITQLGRYSQVRKIEAVLKPIEQTVESFDPGVPEQVEAFVKSEIEKVEAKLTAKADEHETVIPIAPAPAAAAQAPNLPVQS